MKQRALTWLVPSIFILWLFFVLATFFVVQKPFTAGHALAAGRAFLDLAVAGWVALVAWGLGVWLLQWLLPSKAAPGSFTTPDLTGESAEDSQEAGWPSFEASVLGMGLGLGLIGLLSLAVGALGLFRPEVIYILMGLLSLGLLGWFWRHRTYWQLPLIDGPDRWPALYLALIALLGLLGALLPPADWDGLFYHLTGPKLYLQAGGIIGGIDVPHFNFPSLMEMLFAWAMLLQGDIAAKLLHLVFGLLLTGLVYLTTQRFLAPKAGWRAVLILASMPMLITLASWAYNDLALAFYQLASIYSIINYQLVTSGSITSKEQSAEQSQHSAQELRAKIQDHAWLILSGIFAGLAMGLKYTSFVTPVVVVFLILAWGIRKREAGGQGIRGAIQAPRITHHPSRFMFQRVLLDLVIFSTVAWLVASPWYIKNWVFTGNPVYPFLSGVFGGQFWDNFRAAWYAGAGTGIGWQPGRLLALPWILTLGVRDVNYWDGRTGPLWLLFLPLILLLAVPGARKQWGVMVQPSALVALLVYSLAHFGFWTLGVIWSGALFQSRLLLPGLVGVAPLAGWAWLQLPKLDLPRFSLSGFVNIAVAFALLLTAVDLSLFTVEKIAPLPYLTGRESRDTYLTRRLGTYYAAMQAINQDLPVEARVVFLWEPRSYYCQRDCRPDSILDEFPHLVYQYRTAEAIAQAWQEAGITHILVHRAGLAFMRDESPEAIDQEILSRLEEVYWREVIDVAGSYQVYELVGKAP